MFSIYFAHVDFQKCITWPKKSRKRRYERMKVCITASLKLKNLNFNQNKVKCKLLVLVFFSFIVLNLSTPKCCLLIKNMNCASLQAKFSCFRNPFNPEKSLPCHNKQTSPRVTGYVPPPFTWHIS
jgi:hypothetical protein